MTQDKTTLEFKLKEFLLVAIQRVESQPENLNKTIKDVISEFPTSKENEFRKALRNGGLGKYGVTFKLTTQVVCYWIREYKKENSNKLGV